MLRNFAKIAWRNLLKNRTFSIINIVGLSLSVAFCLLLFFYIRNEQSYDTFPGKKDRLFRFESTNTWGATDAKPASHLFSFLTKDNEVDNTLQTSLIIGRDIERSFPEVKSITRFQDQESALIKVDKTVYKIRHLVFADDNFFKNFSFRIINGNPQALAASVKNIIISQSTAKKFFGSANPVGKNVHLVGDSSHIYNVAAIAADAPVNSSIQYDAVFPLPADPDYQANIDGGFNHASHLLILELKEGVSAAAFSTKLNQWAQHYFVQPFMATHGKDMKAFDFSTYRWYLRPFADCHYNISNGWGHYTNANNIYQLACLVIIILLIASLNYILLVISNAAARSQEVGVRKVMGASRKSVILQFWVETQIIVLISVFIGLILSILLLPVFNSLIGSDLTLRNLSWPGVIPGILFLCLFLGMLAGYYPALIISRMKPVSILKSFRTFKINPYFSRILVVTQYTASVILMISAFVINRQMHYVSEKDLGFDKDQVLIVSNPSSSDEDFTRRMKERMRNFFYRNLILHNSPE